MIDTISLQLFIRVAKLRVIAEAGRDLKLSPASASARLSKLEQTVGFQLFNRTTRAVSLTTDGELFLPYAEHVLETLDSGLNAVSKKDEAAKGVLRMAMPASFGRMYIVPLLGKFHALYPGISLDLRLSDEIIDMAEGGYDLTIRNANLNDSNLIAKKLADDKRLLVASPQYLEKFGVPETINGLKKHQCVSLGSGLLKFENGESLNLKPTSVVNDGEVMRIMLEQGFGIGVKSLWNAKQSLQSGELVAVLPEFSLKTDASLWLLYPKGRMTAPKVRLMVDFLMQHFSPNPPWENNR